ncbi:hypothetical protein [Colwellia psychrerythraea]|uniref:Lipoprotein n=1 Tax=Colwellia psychrerythraea TaxID=28229 RepID=A0A099KMP8_COLPS|nr:hypothetical protein [Colwellia psychrerythraea]KGJ91177.1 hypothetical protein GAB14E_3329 [Colwellia psychrerythraea]
MNKNKIALGVLCAVLASGFVYQQMSLSNQDQQGTNRSSAEEVNKPTVASAIENSTPTTTHSGIDRPLLAPPQPSDIHVNTDSSSVTSSKTKDRVVAQSHQLPADHRSASQPKAHGHENQHRHPEDNSLLPPGEPKKPLPTEEGNG